MHTPRIVSIQVGLPQTHGTPGAEDPLEQPWRTGFYKTPVAGPVYLGRTNLVGDGQANRRVPCANITHRWKLPGLTERVRATGRHGWYMRVLQEGEVEAGQPITLLERPCAEWTIQRAFDVMGHRANNRVEAARLAAVPALATSWRQQLAPR